MNTWVRRVADSSVSMLQAVLGFDLSTSGAGGTVPVRQRREPDAEVDLKEYVRSVDAGEENGGETELGRRRFKTRVEGDKPLACFLLLAATVFLSAGPTTVAAGEVPDDERRARPPQPKSVNAAVCMALGFSFLSVADTLLLFRTENAGLMVLGGAGVLGAMVAPSAGHIYAGEYERAAWMSAGRLGAAGVAGAGFYFGFSRALHDFNEDFGDDGSVNFLLGVGIAGTVMYLGLALFDIVTSPLAVERYNRRAMVLEGVTVFPLLMPAMVRDRGLGVAPGLGMAGHF